MSVLEHLVSDMRVVAEEQFDGEYRDMREALDLMSEELLPGGLKRARGGAGSRCLGVEDYDPVLRWHCRR